MRTERLILRPWRDDDIEPFVAMSADTEVMRHLLPMDRERAIDWIERQKAHEQQHGFCFWAVEVPGVLPLAGAIGLAQVTAPYPFAPTVEIGWRIVRAAWGQGYAEEAARASLDFGFARGIPEIVAFTVPANTRSWGMMERLGMTRDADGDFDHHRIEAGNPLRRHILYRLSSQNW
jgi:RimJ/RimL family protein N-acetyltransferase